MADVYKKPTHAETIRKLAPRVHDFILECGGQKIFLEALIYSFRTMGDGVGGLDQTSLRFLIDIETAYLNYIKRYDDNENMFAGAAWHTLDVMESNFLPKVTDVVKQEVEAALARRDDSRKSEKRKARKRR